MASKVYLIGAGPGDPELLTLKGRTCLERADVVVYDYLANSALLSHARADAELIFVGKRGFSDHVTQEQINTCIIEKAFEADGRIVARLKGGDPFVFGRGGEEALALVEAGVPFEVVPGVTSGVAAPAYAGIPVTHRGLASSVAFVTGNEDPTKPETAIDWDHLAHGADTLCFYMGIRNLPHITERLIACGRHAQTPVALVRWGSLARQEVLTGTLEDIAQRALDVDFQAPAITVVGEVANLREQLTWFEKRPLFDSTIVVTRSRTQASGLVNRLGALGAEVIEFPTIEIVGMDSHDELDAAIGRLGVVTDDTIRSAYSWIVFTSVNGVEYFFDRLLECGKDARALAGVRCAAIGPATAACLCEQGVVPDLVPDEFRGEAVVEGLFSFGVGPGDRILIPRAAQAREALPEALREAGVAVDVVAVYKTVCTQGPRTRAAIDRFLAKEVDAVTFTSSSTVRNFIELMESTIKRNAVAEAIAIRSAASASDNDPLSRLFEGDVTETITDDSVRAELVNVLENVKIFSIGPITTKTIVDAGLTVEAQATEYTIDGLVRTIQEAKGSKR